MVHELRTTLAAAVIVSMCGTAMGQNALGDGTALDRNLQVGSGGRNTQVRDLQSNIRFNESIINGSAGRGKSFHGNVGYRASDEFGSLLPSNDLYTFRRDSTQSVLGGMGVRGSDALRYQFAAATGQALPSALAGGLGIPRSFSSTPGQVRSSSTSSLRSTADFLTSQAVRPTLVGYRADDSGALYTATASPLLGVTWYPLQQDSGLSANLSANDPRPAAAAPGTRTVPKPIGLTGMESTAAGLPSPVDIAGLQRDRDTAKPGVPPVTPKIRSESYTKVLDAFRDSYVEQTGIDKPTDAVSREDPNAPWYRDLDQLRETLRFGRDSRDESRDRPSSTQSSTPTPSPAPTPGAATPEPPDAETPDPTTPRGPMRIPGVQSEDLISPPKNAGPKAEDFLSSKMVDILRESGVRIDTFRPLAPTLDQTGYATHMQNGQTAISEGRFFDAEDRFARAMSAMPGDPMAAVGRMHAQLGAGLYLSAASNLRALLRDHPELAAARFNIALVPGEDRAKSIAEQLRIEIADGGVRLSRDASLLLAYLGRLHSNTAWQDEGLAAWRERIASDDAPELALHELLSKVWAAK
jgi:hypothetical protein